MPISRAPFGQTAAGEPVELFTLTNAAGMQAQITTYGGTLVALQTPDRAGALSDVLLGFDNLAGYLGDHSYFGGLIGRYGNRIAHGRFVLDGVTYTLPTNNGPNHLHGGPGGFHTRLWQASVSGNTLALRYTSPDGEQGYPGQLTVAVDYTLTDANALRIDYAAQTDAPTVLNLTNHAYFNLAGAGDILRHELQIAAERFVALDDLLIPTGELLPVAGTPLDFTSPQPIGAGIAAGSELLRRAYDGYDHCLVFGHGGALETCVARVYEPGSGRVMELFTTQPGVQLYSGNFLDGSQIGKRGQAYARYAGFCLETQHLPDSPNRPQFPSTVLRPGERYAHTTIYRFSVE